MLCYAMLQNKWIRELGEKRVCYRRKRVLGAFLDQKYIDGCLINVVSTYLYVESLYEW